MGLVTRRPLRNGVSRSILLSSHMLSRISWFFILFLSFLLWMIDLLIGFSFIAKQMPNFIYFFHVVIGFIWLHWDGRLGQPLNRALLIMTRKSCKKGWPSFLVVLLSWRSVSIYKSPTLLSRLVEALNSGATVLVLRFMGNVI